MNKQLILLSISILMPLALYPAASTSVSNKPINTGLMKEFRKNPASFDASLKAEQGRPDFVQILGRNRAFLQELKRLQPSPYLDFLRAAISNNCQNIMKLMVVTPEFKLIKGRGPGFGGISLVHAAFDGNNEIMKILLDAGVDKDACMPNGLTSLVVAAEKGYIDMVQMLLNAGADKDQCRNDGITPLLSAVRAGHAGIVKLLLDAGADKDRCAYEGSATPLYIAMHYRHIDIVKMLLDAGADVNKCMSDGTSPLYKASEEGHIDIVKMLLDAGADANKCRSDGTSSLSIAAELGHNEIVVLLLDAGADIEKSQKGDFAQLLSAATETHDERLKALLDARADREKIMDGGITPLVIAVQKGHKETVKILLEAGADINKCMMCGITPLMFAVQTEQAEMVKILLEAGADMNKCALGEVTPLLFAVQQGYVDIVNILLDAGADKDKCKDYEVSPLSIAAGEGHDEILKMLLAAGADKNKCNSMGFSPLLIAVWQGRHEAVRILLDHQLDINVKTTSNLTLLHLLGLSKTESTLSLLEPLIKDHVASLYIRDRYGNYPLHYVVQSRHSNFLQFLVTSGVNIEDRNKYGETPLYVAARRGNLAAVQLLCQAGANTQAKNILQLTPIDIAEANGYKKIVQILRAHQKPLQSGSSIDKMHASSSTQDEIPQEMTDLLPASSNQLSMALIATESVRQTQQVRAAAPGKQKKAKAKVKVGSRGQKVALNSVLNVFDHMKQDTPELFALRQPEQDMTVIVYKEQAQSNRLPKLKNVRNMSGKKDKFHTFSSEVDKYLAHGIYINKNNYAEHKEILDEHGISEFNGFAILLPGKIEQQFYDARYALFDKNEPTFAFAGAFVFLFDANGACYHRCFHENKASKEMHRFGRSGQ